MRRAHRRAGLGGRRGERRRALRCRLAGSDGFTLIELLVAALVLAVGVGALTTVLVGSRKQVDDSERHEAASHVAEQAMEDVLSLPYASIGLSSLPQHSPDQNDPDYYVTGQNYKWDQTAGSAAGSEQLVSGGTVAPATAWNDGRLTGVIHRYVTSVNVGPATPVRRVTVAVTVTGGQRRIKPSISSSIVSP